MPPSRFTKDELVDKALLAVKEAARQRARDEAVPRTHALRFALAFLADGQDRRVYDMFWKAVTEPLRAGEVLSDSFGRRQTIDNACGFIHRKHGREPG